MCRAATVLYNGSVMFRRFGLLFAAIHLICFAAPHALGNEVTTFRRNGRIEIQSQHYRLQTTFRQPKEEIQRLESLAKRLDRFFARVTDELGLEKRIRGKRKFRVKIYAKRAEFQAFCRGTNYPWLARGGGFFNQTTRSLITYYRDGYNMRRVLFHEGTHQILDRIGNTQKIPIWWNEGLAVCFEAAEVKPGEFRFDAINPRRLRALRKAKEKGPIPTLFQLSRLDYRGFHADAFGPIETLNYAHSWAFVHFILNGPEEFVGELKRGMMACVREERTQDQVLPAKLCRKLEPTFWEYVKELKLPERKKPEEDDESKKSTRDEAGK